MDDLDNKQRNKKQFKPKCKTNTIRTNLKIMKSVFVSNQLLLWKMRVYLIRCRPQFGFIKLALTQPLFTEVSVLSQESGRSYICVLVVMYLCVTSCICVFGLSILPFFYDFDI